MTKAALYYQKGNVKSMYLYYRDRLRIIYPNGKMQWLLLQGYWEWRDVCYGNACQNKPHEEWHSQFPSFKHAVKAMNEFDKRQGYKKAEFIGWV